MQANVEVVTQKCERSSHKNQISKFLHWFDLIYYMLIQIKSQSKAQSIAESQRRKTL